MKFDKIKSHAKLNLTLNITGKYLSLHKIESIIMFDSLHDDVFIKKIESKNHHISFFGKFSNNIGKKNSVFKLLQLLEKKKLLQSKKFHIKINKRIPNKAGLGGGSMNAANILKYFIKKKIIKNKKREIFEICKLIGSDVILGLNLKNSILNSQNEIKCFSNCKKFYNIIVKPNFGCATKDIYSKVKKFDKPKLNRPNKEMFDFTYLKNMNNSLEPIVFSKYSKLEKIKLYLENLPKVVFVRMTGSGSALVAYFLTKESCDKAKKQFDKKYKNIWSIASKTI
tara:strand:- start:1295 stop:2140 length:846 start_codon:yes stop_codon:yes gene_type:complete